MSQQNSLTLDQKQKLSNSFSLVSACERNKPSCIWLPKLLDHEQCEKLLYELTPVIHSPSLKVTASLLSKRYAFLATASSLYAMSVYNAGINMSAENCYLDYHYEQYLWQSKMPILNISVSHPLNSLQRFQWREEVVRTLFADNLSLLWGIMKDVTNVHPRILWENTAVRVYSLYEKKIASTCPKIRQRILEDYDYLLNQARPDVFGISYNPLKHYNFKKIKLINDEKPVRFRKSCCFYYKATKPIEYCSNCPLVLAKQKKKR